MKAYKHYDSILGIFVALLLISNVASSAKIVDFGYVLLGIPLIFDAGTVLFPLSYIFGDILTEVYGFARARRVIWIGFFASALMSAYMFLVQSMPSEAEWSQYAGDEAFAAILGGISSGGIILASLCAYILGEFSNSVILAKMKVAMQGKYLWMRTIGSTLVGQAFDTTTFVLIACAMSVFPWSIAMPLIVANYIFKVGIEVVLTPLTYAIVSFLKQADNEDVYDKDTDFNPFHVY